MQRLFDVDFWELDPTFLVVMATLAVAGFALLWALSVE